MVPGLTAIRGLQNGRARSYQPAAVLINESSAKQEITSWRLHTNPVRAGVARGIDHAAFPKCPPVTAAVEDCAR
jgi:hypothetical protein